MGVSERVRHARWPHRGSRRNARPADDTGVIHAISSDPVQAHNDCPAINEVGFLSPGETGQTFPLSIARTCGFHDHTNEFNAAFKGRIVIQ